MASIMRRVPNLKGKKAKTKTEEHFRVTATVKDMEHLLSVYPVPDTARRALHILSQKAETQRN